MIKITEKQAGFKVHSLGTPHSYLPLITRLCLLALVACAGTEPPPTTITPLPTVTATAEATPTKILPSPTPAGTLPFVWGVDASFLPQIEANGGLFYDRGVARPGIELFAAHGINLVRLRLWVNPAGGENGLEQTLQMARRVKAAGLALLLDLHYSDTWADPAHQSPPAAWSHLDGPALNTAVHDYTQNTLAAFKAQNTLPDIVQIGNEISSGFLWPAGRVGGAYQQNWPQFLALLQAGALGVQDALAPGDRVKILLHLDAGGNNELCRWFFDHVPAGDVPFDLIGLSFYPWWHGSLPNLEANVLDLAARYQKPILIVETAYPWTLAWNDGVNNLVGLENQLLPGYPATPAGQALFLADVTQIMRDVPAGLGAGIIYWAAEAITTPAQGSFWENMALFDFAGNSLPAWEVPGR